MATRESRRVCHWALRTGNLRDALTFYELVFGLRILRHEEFAAGHPESGGAYGGAWSKTVVGWGPERTDFALELTYSYGADDTTQADGLLHIAVACPEAATRAAALGYAVAYDRGAPVVAGPDDVKYKIVEPSSGRAERWSAVCLKSASLRSTERYFVDVLGWTKFARPPPGCSPPGSSLTLGFDGDDQVRVVFCEGSPKPGARRGRLAVAVPDARAAHDAASGASIGSVVAAAATLKTPGRADVDVSVLADPDGYEVAVLGAAGFYDLARPRYDAVDWRLREARGADGREPPPSTAPLATPGMVAVHDAAALDALASSQDRVVAHFAAKWCKNCARMEPELAAMAAKTDAHAFALIDVDEAEDLAAKYNVTSVPHFVFLKGGAPADAYVGSSAEELQAKLAVCFL